MIGEEDTRKPGRDLMIFVGLFIILGVVWYVRGGPDRPPEPGGSFFGSISTGNIQPGGGSNQGPGLVSPDGPKSDELDFKRKIVLQISNAKKENSDEEYIVIKWPSNTGSPLDLSGWTLEGVVSTAIKIPQAVDVYLSNQVNLQQDIILQPGDELLVISGQSPLAANLRLNKCSGYFSQFKKFYPSIPQRCPYPRDENWPSSLQWQCLDYIEKLPRCKANLTLPFNLDNECIQAINGTLSYNKCVELHKNDVDFYDNEWRVYLNRTDEVWRNRYETIVLRDDKGNIIKEASYK